MLMMSIGFIVSCESAAVVFLVLGCDVDVVFRPAISSVSECPCSLLPSLDIANDKRVVVTVSMFMSSK